MSQLPMLCVVLVSCTTWVSAATANAPSMRRQAEATRTRLSTLTASLTQPPSVVGAAPPFHPTGPDGQLRTQTRTVQQQGLVGNSNLGNPRLTVTQLGTLSASRTQLEIEPDITWAPTTAATQSYWSTVTQPDRSTVTAAQVDTATSTQAITPQTPFSTLPPSTQHSSTVFNGSAPLDLGHLTSTMPKEALDVSITASTSSLGSAIPAICLVFGAVAALVVVLGALFVVSRTLRSAAERQKLCSEPASTLEAGAGTTFTSVPVSTVVLDGGDAPLLLESVDPSTAASLHVP